MQRLVLAVLLMALCSTAAADWVLLGAVPDDRSPLGGYSIHADPATIVRSGDTVALWFLMDFRTAQRTADAKAYSSQKVQWQFDCKERLWRTLSWSAHAGPMAAGDVVVPAEGKADGWQPVPPTTLMEVYWKLVCSRT